jgi:hypothetical protein
VCKLLRDVSPLGGKLVVGALASQQRPGATDAGPVEWTAVCVFPRTRPPDNGATRDRAASRP